MDIQRFEVGPFSENTYLLSKEGKSILIDPGFFDPREMNNFSERLDELKSELIAVCLTHAHVDHILGLEKVLKVHKVPVYLNHSDLYLWENFPQQSFIFGFRTSAFDFTPNPLPEQAGFRLGPFSFDVLYTPGHAPDHVSLYFPAEEVLISGDALFHESIGRTDLYKGDFELLASSIREKLYTLPAQTKVYPGHGPATSIGHERTFNPFVKSVD